MREVQAIKTLLPLLSYYPWAIPAIVVLGFAASLAEGIGISLFVPFLQSLDAVNPATASQSGLIQSLNQLFAQIPPSDRRVIVPLCIFGSVMLKNALLYGNTIFFSWLNWRISHRLRSGIFRQLLQVGYSYLDHNPSGKFLSILDRETWQTSQALAGLVGLMINCCTIAVFTTLLLLISWRLTLLVGIVMIVISFIIQTLTRRMKGLGQQAANANATFVHRTLEGLGGMRVIRAFGRESYEQDRFDRASLQVCRSFMRLDWLSALIQPVSEVLSTALLAGMLIIALREQSNLPTLLTFIFMLYRLQPPVKQLDSARVNLVALAASVEAVMAVLDSSDKPYIRSGQTPIPSLQRSIVFDHVSFHYAMTEAPALNEVSISIPKGKTTAFVGPSGAGKSTLIGLICRFYDVTVGTIWIDDRPLPHLNLADWRSRLAIVSQEIHIFSTTIRENIAYGRLEASDAEIIAAAKQANAHDFIGKLPQGYDTKVGDRGLRLSGGQRQRIALARAIVRDPEILILDEATNALDSISEHLIQEALNTLSKNRTVIVIAHRLSTIEQADQIIVMNEGHVVEQGNLEQLLQQQGLFARLYRLQYRSA